MSKISFETEELDLAFEMPTNSLTEVNNSMIGDRDSLLAQGQRPGVNNVTMADQYLDEEQVTRQLLELSQNAGTGEGAQNLIQAKKKLATHVPGLIPINLDSNFEFYLGVRQPTSKRYEGDRLYFDKETTELGPCAGSTPHAACQLWKFQRAPDHQKGIHSIVAVEAQARLTCSMREDDDDNEEAQVVVDFTNVFDQDNDSSATNFYMDQLFQVFVDEKSDTKDIVIKMFQGPENEERFLCVELEENAIDFLSPTEFPPTRFVLNIPANQIVASSMEVHSIERKAKNLISSVETLRNSTDMHQEMEVTPPAASINNENKSVFFDSVHIWPQLHGPSGNTVPMIVVGGQKDNELQISVHDQKAVIMSDKALPEPQVKPLVKTNGHKMGFNRIGFTYERQIFSATYDQKLVQVPPYSTNKVKTNIVQILSVARFTATFTMRTHEKGHVQFAIPGEATITEHKFEAIAQPGRGCCGSCDCTIF